MFCDKCGAQIAEKGKYCPKCGAAAVQSDMLFIKPTAPLEENSKLLWESKGPTQLGGRNLGILILDGAVAAVGITLGIENERFVFLFFGVAALLMLGAALPAAKNMSKGWIKIYEDHIEGFTSELRAETYLFNGIYPSGEMEKFCILHQQVVSVSVNAAADFLEINAGGRTYKLFCQNAEKGYQLIRQQKGVG